MCVCACVCVHVCVCVYVYVCVCVSEHMVQVCQDCVCGVNVTIAAGTMNNQCGGCDTFLSLVL